MSVKGTTRATGDALREWMRQLSLRLRRVRCACGDWSRVCGPSVTFKLGTTAVFLDPPYSAAANRDSDLYSTDNLDVAHGVRAWAIANGDNPLLRIALCGYDSEHGEHMPDGWETYTWTANGGYEGQAAERSGNRHREVIWFSQHCLKPTAQPAQLELAL